MNDLLSLVIVDDEPMIADSLAELYPWREWGFEVAGVYYSADSMLAALGGGHVDVVLTDIRMPGTDGLDFARILVKERIASQTVLLSAYADFEYARQAMHAGVFDYLTKPVQYEKIATTFSLLHQKLCARRPASPSGDDNAYHGKLAAYACRYAEEHMDTATLETVASNLGFTPSYVSRIFHGVTGKTFSRHLLECRMTRAAKLLSGPFTSISSVAYVVGYDNVPNFNRTFAKFHGMTPSQYALQCREAKENPDA